MPYTVKSPGSVAKMGDIDVYILAVMIRGPLVKYEVSWICNGDRKSEWVESFELGEGTEITEVGFE